MSLVDDLDRQLLGVLTSEGRISMADLGRRIGLSRTATLARVTRMEREGVIRGYHADVALTPGADHVARVAIVVKTRDVAAYIRRLMDIEECQEVESVAGEYDLMARFSAASAARLNEILDRLNGWRDTVRTTTFMVLSRYGREQR
jgi:Lrp/AsnC family transcriptional regulator, leucine-responsive regulatory protein